MCYADTDSFIVDVKTDGIYKDIVEDVETRFVTLNFELDRPLPKGRNKKVIGLMKDILGGLICWIKSKNTYLFKRQQWWR